MADEKKITAASYILNYYETVWELTQRTSNYMNLMIELQSKYGNKSFGVDTSDQISIAKILADLRQSIQIAYVQYITIINQISNKTSSWDKDTELKELYTELGSKYVIESKKIEEYTILHNQFLAGQVMQNLLRSSQDIINALYSQTSQTGNTQNDRQK